MSWAAAGESSSFWAAAEHLPLGQQEEGDLRLGQQQEEEDGHLCLVRHPQEGNSSRPTGGGGGGGGGGGPAPSRDDIEPGPNLPFDASQPWPPVVVVDRRDAPEYGKKAQKVTQKT